MTYTPVSLLEPAAVLVDVWLTAADDGRGCFRAAARTLHAFGVGDTPDSITLAVAAAFSAAAYPPTPREGARWEQWHTRIVDDVARRLAWLTDPADDEDLCLSCGRLVVAPRGDLAVGDLHCDHCEDTSLGRVMV